MGHARVDRPAFFRLKGEAGLRGGEKGREGEREGREDG